MSANNGIATDPLNAITTLASTDDGFTVAPPPPKKKPFGANPAEAVLYGEVMTGEELQAINEECLFDYTKPYTKPIVVVSSNGRPLLTIGNFSVVGGKQKSGKSGFVAAITALCLNPHSQHLKDIGLRCEVSEDRLNVLYFDTEQGEYHVSLMARKILYLAELNPQTTSVLKLYQLRGKSPYERLAFIDATIRSYSDSTSFVVIDGIRDLCLDINDSKEATDLINTWLMKITQEASVHVCFVLHENKGNDLLRGHLGTESQNKLETMFSVEKDNERELARISVPFSRDKGMKPIGMSFEEITEDGNVLWLPKLYRNDSVASIGTVVAKQNKAPDITNEQTTAIAIKIWQSNPQAEYRPSELLTHIEACGKDIALRTIPQREQKSVVSTMEKVLGLISSNGKETKSKRFTASAKLISMINTIPITQSDSNQIEIGLTP
ncbi:MAG: AAA family ATPase [Candidatus Kapabacteria bacterium]|nr:MAG: hypothetical protein UZ22_OP11002000854 [Microgenomates bacterium OLB23]MBW7852803.1 AAA family ATPase [Candidatus Kapabacteria bacterium]